MLLGKIEISKERGLLCVSREGETLFGAYFISRILSFPAYARDATCSSARIFAKMIFHFPLMREMQRGVVVSPYRLSTFHFPLMREMQPKHTRGT